MKKKWINALFIFIILFSLGTSAASAQSSQSDLIQTQLDNVDFSEIQVYLDQIDRDIGEYLPNLDFKNIFHDIRRGNVDLSFEGVVSGIGKYMFREILIHSRLLGTLLILAVLYAVLKIFIQALKVITTQDNLGYAV